MEKIFTSDDMKSFAYWCMSLSVEEMQDRTKKIGRFLLWQDLLEEYLELNIKPIVN